MKNTRSITIDGKEVSIRGLYHGELDDSSRAALKAAVGILDDINIDTLDQLMARREATPTEKTATGKRYKGLHKGTLLSCGVVSVDGDEVGIAEFVLTLDGKDADELAEAVASLTRLPDDEGNLESE